MYKPMRFRLLLRKKSCLFCLALPHPPLRDISDGFQHPSPSRIGCTGVIVDLTMWQLASSAFYRWGESEKPDSHR